MNTALRALLRHLGLDPTAEEIADLLWLAAQYDAPGEVGPGLGDARLPNERSKPQIKVESQGKSRASSGQTTEAGSTTADLYPKLVTDMLGGSAARPFRSPAAYALPAALELGRSLRPLKRRTASRTRFALDETATAHHIADTGDWMAVLLPAPERWLAVTVVVDESSSMVIWQQMIGELLQLLERQGAFRSIQVWGFRAADSDSALHLYSGYGLSARRDMPHRPAELIDPLGRRLIMVVSDCVAPIWHNGVMAGALAQWGTQGLVTLVQTLPERLWSRTGLRTLYWLFVRAAAAGTPNSALEIRWKENRPRPPRENALQNHHSREKLAGWHPAGSVPVPVVTLEAIPLSYWSRSLAGASGVWIPGVLAAPGEPSTPPLPPPAQDVDELLCVFDGSASLTARRLATYLSAVPLTLPIMRLVQQAMLPESRQVHLAEVFLSGLIRHPPIDDSEPANRILYDFVSDEVRERLQDNLRDYELGDVLQAVSAYISERASQPLDFAALLADPTAKGSLRLGEEHEPFARIAANALRRFGGQYADIAARLDSSIGREEEKVITPIPVEAWANEPLREESLQTASILSWLHLSDLHFRAEDALNRKVVLDALWQDIKDRMKDGLRPDFIAFTGDVAWQGQEEEYRLAEEYFFKPLLATTGLTPNELFIVPGNHDVDWNISAMLSVNVVAQLQTRDAVNDFLASDRKRETVFMSTAAYAAFIRRVFAGYWEPDDPADWYTRTFQKNGKTVALLGLNSAWLSGHFKEADQVNDYGRLLVGELQVAQAVDAAKTADIKIALLHHPFEWCQEFDRSDVESRLREACHFILRGHRHRAGFIQEVTFDGECVIIPAGAAYDRRSHPDRKYPDREYPNGYAFVQLDLRTGRGIMHLRRYGDSLRRWVKDVEATGETRDGRWDFTLPKALGTAFIPPTAISTTSGTPAPDRRTLRELEKALGRLADAIAPWEEESQEAFYDGRSLTIPEYTAFSHAWDASQKPYREAQALIQRNNDVRDQYDELFRKLSQTHDALRMARQDVALKPIPEKMHDFTDALAVLQTKISADLDWLLS
ncbi:MAG: SAV_2336 N-terminal domain-related protein [Chloroflexi bacterium]|nr:SAV_2336 N-terminal domain-related protein [Chloroflexota bacterium]